MSLELHQISRVEWTGDFMLPSIVFEDISFTHKNFLKKTLHFVLVIQQIFHWITICRLSVLSAITSVQQRLKLYSKGVFCCCSYAVSLTNLLATCDEHKWPHVSWNLTSASALHLPSSNLSEDPDFYSFLLLSHVSLPIYSQAPLCLLTFLLPLFLSVLECYHPSLPTFLHAPSCLTFLFTWSFYSSLFFEKRSFSFPFLQRFLMDAHVTSNSCYG